VGSALEEALRLASAGKRLRAKTKFHAKMTRHPDGSTRRPCAGFVGRSIDKFACGSGRALGERCDDRLQFRFPNERNRFFGIDPLSNALFEFRPRRALPFDQQREDLDLTVRFSVGCFRRFPVSKIADRPGADLPSRAGFLEGLAGGGLRGRQPFDRPTLRNDPPSRPPGRHDEDLKRRGLRKSIGQRAILDAYRRLRPSFLRLARNVASPEASPTGRENRISRESEEMKAESPACHAPQNSTGPEAPMPVWARTD